MDLLQPVPERGHPGDYLSARIAGRRGYLVRDWPGILESADPVAAVPPSPHRPAPLGSDREIWSDLLRESAWLYGELGPDLRRRLAPLFLYLELRTVVLSLRRRAGGRGGELLRHTLLCRELCRALSSEGDPGETVQQIADRFSLLDPRFRSLPDAFKNRGVAGFEERLTDTYLERMGEERLDPAVGAFFRRLIDLRNALTLAKEIRWGLPPSPFLAGGSIPRSRFTGAARDGGERKELALRLLGSGATLETEHRESLLLARMTGTVQRLGREGGAGGIIAYLWSVAMQARNLSLLVNARGVGRELLAAELIR